MNKLLCSSMLFLCLCSCKKDILDKKPLDALSDAVVWSDMNLAQAFLNNSYAQMYDGFTRLHDGGCRGCFVLDAGSDDGKNSYTWTEAEKFNFNNFTSSDAPISNTWADMYKGIRSVNIFLQKIDGVPKGDPTVITRLKGEAKFLRAFFYFELMKQYGGVPIISIAQELGSDLIVPRNNYEECVTFVIDNLNEAITALPVDATQTGRASKGAAMALKARVLLYWASPFNNSSNDLLRWQNAADASKAVIDLGKYSLFPNYETLFQIINENNSEVIFDKQYKYPVNAHNYNTFMTPYSKGNFTTGWGGTDVTQEFVDAYEMKDGKSFSTSPLYNPNNPYKNRDPRFYATVLFDSAQFIIGGKLVTFETRVGGDNGLYANQDATKTGYYMGKLIDKNYALDYKDAGNTGEQNWIYMRYAEVLLNYAEAKNESSGVDIDVYNALHLIRQRAGMPDLPGGLSQSEMRDRIRNERRIELSFEEHRFWDIRRWKIAEQVLNKPMHGMEVNMDANGNRTFKPFVFETRVFLPHSYLFPISLSEINKSGGKLTQNPGW